VLNNLRERLRPGLERIGKTFASTGLSANFWTCVGLFFALLSAVVYGLGDSVTSGPVIGGMLLLVSGFFDMVDGQVARITGKTSQKGAYLDSMFDKIAEVAIFLGILVGGYAEPYIVLLAITLSLLVSYARAKSDAINVKLQGVGIGERAERLLVIAIVGIIGFMEQAVIIVVVIAGITMIQRMVVTARNMPE
jgi:archaetidylinositol phosphate synthase